MNENKALTELLKIGQSVWYDNLSRDVLHSGALKSFIDAGVRGLTSNPTIFKKAIADTADYDEDIKVLAAKGMSDDDLTEELMVQDVAAAADLLLPLYQSSKGTDGFASIEVSPFLARDTAETTKAAERLWRKLGRKNVMIKIPGTPECLPSIREALDRGINVNVTLLFSVENYAAVVEQYLSALESRAKRGEPIDSIASVASFFVSRVDAICEKEIAKLPEDKKAALHTATFGKIGVANARLAYDRFLQEFGSARFQALKEKGAHVQRPLWASTGTKNPALSPLLYVEELAVADTVNTMPPQTLDALLSQGGVKPPVSSKDESNRVLKTLADANIHLESLLLKLQVDGVELFAQSFRELLASVAEKRRHVAQ